VGSIAPFDQSLWRFRHGLSVNLFGAFATGIRPIALALSPRPFGQSLWPFCHCHSANRFGAFATAVRPFAFATAIRLIPLALSPQPLGPSTFGAFVTVIGPIALALSPRPTDPAFWRFRHSRSANRFGAFATSNGPSFLALSPQPFGQSLWRFRYGHSASPFGLLPWLHFIFHGNPAHLLRYFRPTFSSAPLPFSPVSMCRMRSRISFVIMCRIWPLSRLIVFSF